jgi:hypothetical protein
MPGGAGLNANGGSVFNAGEDLDDLINGVQHVPGVPSRSRAGFSTRTVDAGRIIGVDEHGIPTSIYTVVIDDHTGIAVSVHPGYPI